MSPLPGTAMYTRITILCLIVAIVGVLMLPGTYHYDTLLWTAEFPAPYDDLGGEPTTVHSTELIRSRHEGCIYAVGSVKEEGATFKYPELDDWLPVILARFQSDDQTNVLERKRNQHNTTTPSGYSILLHSKSGFTQYWITFRHGKLYYVIVQVPEQHLLDNATACSFRDSVRFFTPSVSR